MNFKEEDMGFRLVQRAIVVFTVLFGFLITLAATPVWSADISELERRIDILSDELDQVKSSGGSSLAQRTTVHGYGETHWTASEGSDTKVDQHRFVVGVHSKITDWIHLNMEMDFEHAMSELEFEFGYLDFLISPSMNFRVGTMLMPMGNLNEFHEPNNFFTVERPDFHKNLMPSTWQQAGAGIYGSKGDYSYRAYLVNAVSALDSSRKFRNSDFIRKGRSQITGIAVNDMAVTARVERKTLGGQAGISFYRGGSAGDYIEEDGMLTILMADYKVKRGPFDLDFGVFKGWVADTKEMNAACSNFGEIACAGTIPQSAFALMGTFAVHLPELMKKKTIHDVIPYVQLQKLRPNDVNGDGAAYANGKNYNVVTIGAAYKPHPQVALKAGYRTNYYAGKKAAGARPGKQGTDQSYFEFGVGYQY